MTLFYRSRRPDWKVFRTESAALEPGFLTNRASAALTGEDADGHVWLDRGGEAVEVDIRHCMGRAQRT